MMILSMRMSTDVILTSIRTLFPLLLRLSSEHVCLDANVRNVKLIMPNSSLICCQKLFSSDLGTFYGEDNVLLQDFSVFSSVRRLYQTTLNRALDRLHCTSDSC